MNTFHRVAALLLFALASPFFSYAQWEHMRIPEQGWNLNGLHAFDTAHWVAVGDYGRILTTNDGFRTFRRIPIDTRLDFHSVTFLNASRGIAVGAGGAVAVTDNAGEDWTLLSVGAKDVLWGIAAVGDNAAIAVGAHGAAFRTDDGGASWSRLATPTNKDLYAIAIRGGVAVAVGDMGTAVRSTDGGAAWTLTQTRVPTALRTVAFSYDNVCVAGGDSVYLTRSIDAGATWETPTHLFDEYTSTYFHTIHGIDFADDGVGYLCGEFWISNTKTHYMRIFYTNNGGATWTQPLPDKAIYDHSANGKWLAIKAIDKQRVAAVGIDPNERVGQALYCDDTGVRPRPLWQRRLAKKEAPDRFYMDHRLTSVHFFNIDHGVFTSSTGMFYRTRDGGKSFSSVALRANVNSTQCIFRGAYGAVCYIDTNYIHITADSGKTWSVKFVTPNPNINVWALRMATENLMYAYTSETGKGYNETYNVYRSDDAGATWKRLSLQVPFQYYSSTLPAFSDEKNGSVVVYELNEGGYLQAIHLYRSIDAGETWFDATPTGLFEDSDRGANQIDGVVFSDNKRGFLAMNNRNRGPEFIITEDGGVTWGRSILLNVPNPPKEIERTVEASNFTFYDGNHSTFHASYSGTATDILFQTTNGGATWEYMPVYGKRTPFAVAIFGISYASRDVIWAVGNGFTLMRYIRPKTHVGVEENPSNNAATATGLLIYPNPTSEHFSVDNRAEGQVAVRDVYGRTLAIAKPGETISVQGWPNGTYFATVETRNGLRKAENLVICR